MADDQQSCLFCEIAHHRVPTTIQYEDEHVICFNDIHPSAPIHILIVPKVHRDGFEHLTAADRDLVTAIVLAGQKLIDKLNLGGQFKFIINGPSYRHVEHLHAHLLGGQLSKPLP